MCGGLRTVDDEGVEGGSIDLFMRSLSFFFFSVFFFGSLSLSRSRACFTRAERVIWAGASLMHHMHMCMLCMLCTRKCASPSFRHRH